MNLEFFTIREDLNISTEKFIEEYLTVLNLAPQSEMRFVKSQTNELGIKSSFYQQYVAGYKVRGADMVFNEKAGRLKYVNGAIRN